MVERKEIIFKPTIFSAHHKLILDNEFIEFYKSPEDKDPIRFNRLEIDGFRFGLKWLRGYKVIFGRTYCIDIKNATGLILKIRLNSIYKIRIKELHEKYSLILRIILNYYISEMVDQYLKMFNYKQAISILNVQFIQSGIILSDKYSIEWNNVDIKTHTRYIAISTKSKSDIYKTFDYIDEWNTLVLYNVLRQILRSKNLLSD